MKFPHRLRRASALLFTSTIIAAIVFAQQPKVSAPATQTNANNVASASNAENVALDDLFGADAYAIYGEMRGVGQYVSSEEFKQTLAPLRMSNDVPAEVTDLIDFFASRAEAFASARVAFGAMPVAEGLPTYVAAVELPSAEDAQKLEPQLREFIAGYYAAHLQTTDEATRAGAGFDDGSQPRTTNTPRRARARQSPSAQTQASQSRSSQPSGARIERAGERAATASPAPYVIRRAGAVVAFADKQFTFRRLRGAPQSPALANEPGFAAARARLATDTLFLYFNTTRMGRYTKRQMEDSERRYKEMEAEAAKERGANSNSNANVAVLASPRSANMNGNVAVLTARPDDPAEKLSPEDEAEMRAAEAEMEEQKRQAEELEQKRKAEPGYEQEQRQREFEDQLGRAVFGGALYGESVAQSGWPESIGVGLSLTGDEIVARALFYSDSDTTPARPIPFIPVLLSGPPVTNEAASVVPKGADIYLSASLDLPQMYDYVASVFKIFDAASSATGSTDKLGLFDSQINAFEQQSKFRIKEDLLNSLGNEIAVVLPGEYMGVRRTAKPAKPKPPTSSGDAQTTDDAAPPTGTSAPIILISLKDKKQVEDLLPRALEGVGLKGLDSSQLFVKRGDADVLAFGGGSAAFIGNFLVVSFDPRALDWIIDSYNRGETLANSDEFRRASAWQERQLLGQVFVSNSVLKDSFGDAREHTDDIEDPNLRNYLASLDPNPGAITYSLNRDGASLFHELHVPKNLLALISASSIVARQTSTMRSNEGQASYRLSEIADAESSYKEKNNRYATLAELEAGTKRERADGRERSLFKTEGYEIKLTVSGDKFEATATPTGYPKQGRRSFYIDQTGVLRGGDTGGKPATVESDPVNN